MLNMAKKKDFKLDVLKQKKTIKQYPKFFFSGLIGVIVNISILYTLTDLFLMHYLISAICAAVIASTCNFVLNKTWTFKEEIEDDFWEKYFKFGVVRVFVIFISLVLLFLLTEYLHLYYLISQFISITLMGIISFLAHKIWVFENYKVS